MLNLLPYPRSLERRPGHYVMPERAVLHLDAKLPRDVSLNVGARLQEGARDAGSELETVTDPWKHPRPAICAMKSSDAPAQPEGYALNITSRLITLLYREVSGLRAGVATLRQLLRG